MSEIDNEIKKELPDYYLPYIYIFRKEMPLTSIDKIDYKLLENESYSFKEKIIDNVNYNKPKRKIKRIV